MPKFISSEQLQQQGNKQTTNYTVMTYKMTSSMGDAGRQDPQNDLLICSQRKTRYRKHKWNLGIELEHGKPNTNATLTLQVRVFFLHVYLWRAAIAFCCSSAVPNVKWSHGFPLLGDRM
jgi:hypothetical protein